MFEALPSTTGMDIKVSQNTGEPQEVVRDKYTRSQKQMKAYAGKPEISEHQKPLLTSLLVSKETGEKTG